MPSTHCLLYPGEIHAGLADRDVKFPLMHYVLPSCAAMMLPNAACRRTVYHVQRVRLTCLTETGHSVGLAVAGVCPRHTAFANCTSLSFVVNSSAQPTLPSHMLYTIGCEVVCDAVLHVLPAI